MAPIQGWRESLWLLSGWRFRRSKQHQIDPKPDIRSYFLPQGARVIIIRSKCINLKVCRTLYSPINRGHHIFMSCTLCKGYNFLQLFPILNRKSAIFCNDKDQNTNTNTNLSIQGTDGFQKEFKKSLHRSPNLI